MKTNTLMPVIKAILNDEEFLCGGIFTKEKQYEDINMIRKKMCDKTYFDPQYNDYPILTIWENGDSIEKIEGGNVLKKIAEEINKL